MPEPLDLEAINARSLALSQFFISGGHDIPRWNDAVAQSAADVPALITEIERLRAIAGPLERLEAWRAPEERLFELWEVEDEDGYTMIRVELSDGDREAAGFGATVHTAITAALDAWNAKYGKDTP